MILLIFLGICYWLSEIRRAVVIVECRMPQYLFHPIIVILVAVDVALELIGLLTLLGI